MNTNEHWFWGKVSSHRSIYWRVALAASLINLFSVSSAIFMMVVYDRVIPNAAFSSLYALTVGMLIVLVFDFILRNLRAWFLDFAGTRIDQTVGKDIYNKVLSSYSLNFNHSVGGLSNTLKDFDLVKDFFTSASLAVLIDLPFIIFFVIIIFLIAGPVGLVPLSAVPLVIGVGILVQPKLNKISEVLSTNTRGKQAVIVESLSGLEAINSLGGNKLFLSRYNDSIEESAVLGRRSKMLSQLAVHTATSMQQICLVGIIFYGTFLIYEGSISMGAMIAAVLLSSRCLGPLAQIAGLLGRFHLTKSAYLKLDSLIKELDISEEKSEDKLSPEKLGSIEFKNLSFGYDNSRDCLQGLNFKVDSGERIAILGKNGSGKSTLLKLVTGLIKTSSGMITFSGLPQEQISKEALTRLIGIQLQDTQLFSGSLKDNIFLGREWIDEQYLSAILDLSGVESFLHLLPGGLDYLLSDRGMSLSGGQRQSISLARTLIAKPEILLLDEPTSSMDLNSEQAFADKLRDHKSSATIIVATHRLPVLSAVNRVIVLSEGKIVLDDVKEEALKKLTKQQQ